MITSMREYFRSLKFVLLIVIVAFIATSVVYFGASSLDGRDDPQAVAAVNGETISLERFRRVYANYVDFYQQVYKERFSQDVAERLGLSDQVLNDLILEALIIQRAEREGIRVGDDELRARIHAMRAFHEDGKFSRERYLSVLKRARVDPSDFETEQRRELQRRKVEVLIKDGVKVSEDELRQVYVLRRETVRAAWASLPIQTLMTQVTVSDAEVEPYLKAHQAQFTRPERRRLQYVLVSAKLFALPVSDADAEAYFKEHAAEFDKPRRLRTAHVLVRVPPTGGSEAENRSRAKVEDVIKRAKGGEDFGKLAREISEDAATASQGGDLGLVAAGEMVPQFEQAVFALKKGEVSATPVRTAFGYHAIKVLELEEGGRPAFKDVAARIKERLLNERSDRAAQKKAEEVKPALQGATDFAAEGRRLGLEAREATIARGDSLEGIGRDRELEEAIFSLAAGGVSPPIKTPGGYAVVRVAEQFPAGVPPLAQIKDQVIEAAKRAKAEALGTERGKALAGALSQGGDFALVAKREGFAVGETTLFSRQEPPKDRGTSLPGDVLVAALHTVTGQLAEPVRTPTAVYLVKTLERQLPDPQGFEKEREELLKQVLEQKRSEAWEGWLAGSRAQAKIELKGQPPSRR